jgi:L-alanine-DL-glutamate epimerase-like enolase superfamily enzyme
MLIEDGHAIPSDEPGLGIAWDFQAIAKATVEGSGFTLS